VIAEGVHPLEEKRKRKAAALLVAPPKPSTKTVEWCCKTWHANNKAQWRTEHYKTMWLGELEKYAFPFVFDRGGRRVKFGNMPIDQVDDWHAEQVFEPLYKTRVNQAKLMRRRMERVVIWAEGKNHRTKGRPNPFRLELFKEIMPKVKIAKPIPRPALDFEGLPSFVHDLRAWERKEREPGRGGKANADVYNILPLALELTILNGLRPGQIGKLLWADLKQESGVSVLKIPPENMKEEEAYDAPLSSRSVAILDEVRKRSKGSDSPLMFPAYNEPKGSERSPVSDLVRYWSQSQVNLVHELRPDVDVVTHGFRSTFRDWAGDEADVPPELAEHQLAHKYSSETTQGGRSYRRRKAVRKRAVLMELYTVFCAGGEGGDKVPALAKKLNVSMPDVFSHDLLERWQELLNASRVASGTNILEFANVS
jgi:integrase